MVMAVRDHFLTAQLCAHVAGQLGWTPAYNVELVEAPLDP